MMHVNSDTVFYKSSDGEMITNYETDDGPCFWSPDGVVFYELLFHFYKPNGAITSLPHHENRELEFVWKTNGDVLVSGKLFHNTKDDRTEIEVVRLLPDRAAMNLYSFPNGELLYLSGSLHYRPYGIIKLFMGQEDGLRYVPVRNINRFSSGSIFVSTAEGVVYSPGSRRLLEGRKPTWVDIEENTTELAELDLDLFEIVESEDKVHIKRL